jgi:hypothetical protein
MPLTSMHHPITPPLNNEGLECSQFLYVPTWQTDVKNIENKLIYCYKMNLLKIKGILKELKRKI